MNSNSNNNLPILFNYEGKQVRSVKIDGEAWFVAKDVCDILEIVNHRDAVTALDDDEKRHSEIPTPSNSGYSDMVVINQPGVFKLALRGRKEEAKRFTRWVTHDVLPEIYRTGSYTHPAVKQAREEKPKPVAIPRDIKIYLSKANFSAQEKIINRAFDASYIIKKNGVNDETDKECLKILALDIAFKKRTGYSALEAAGISIEQNTKGNIAEEDNWFRIDWVPHYNVVFRDERLILPEPTFEEYFTDE